MSFVWGISGIDRSGYDIDFDIYHAANQNKLVSFCNSLLTEVCTDESGAVLSGCSSPGGRLVRSNTMECFMTEFQQWHQNMFAVASTDASVNRSTFMTRLKIFRAQQRPANDAKSSWKNQIGFINGELKFVRVSFLGSVQILKPVRHQDARVPVYESSCRQFQGRCSGRTQVSLPGRRAHRLALDAHRVGTCPRPRARARHMFSYRTACAHDGDAELGT